VNSRSSQRRVIHRLDRVGSTNDAVLDIAGTAPDGTVVVAKEQTRGRGRMGRTWHSPEGGLWFSVLFWPEWSVDRLPLLNLLLGIPVARAIRALGVEANVKWPNDILIRRRKAGGLLGETHYRGERLCLIVGIGVNSNLDLDAFPPSIAGRVTSLRAELGSNVDNEALLSGILDRIERLRLDVRAGRVDELLDTWRRLSVGLGERVHARVGTSTFEGVARDIDTDGRLLVETSGGIERLTSAASLGLL
jgi:BirA family biotin operon repressor/biotin-[acetyl-CoA-carboxylase] ligase